jgi:dimeric dUTPase (all-alpha-NTP-PPase superfamily)
MSAAGPFANDAFDSKPDRLSEIFYAQESLQVALGNDLPGMDTRTRIAYVKDMILALENELHSEVLGEIQGWKPWTKGEPSVNMIRARAEVIDAAHFLLNLFMAFGGDAEDFYVGYLNKNDVNHERAATGYTGTEGKCTNRLCGRELHVHGEPVNMVIKWTSGEEFCSHTCELEHKRLARSDA